MSKELKIQKIMQVSSPLLRRIDFVAQVQTFDGASPSRYDMFLAFKNKLGCDEKLLILTKIRPLFGTSDCEVYGHIYDTEEDMLKITPQYLLKRRAIALGLQKSEEEEE